VTFQRTGCLIFVALCLQLTGCGLAQGSGKQSSNGPLPSDGIPATFFGMHQMHMAACDSGAVAFPLFDAPAGAFRDWSTCRTQWADMNPASGVFDFSGLDLLLAALKSRGIDDVFISLGRVPPWISSDPTDTLCDAANTNRQPPGMCHPPKDLNPDGTGTDWAWRNFVTNLVSHVASSEYLTTHAHIRYYEIWSEFHRSDTVSTATCQNPAAGISCSYRGTFAQMLRMAQDIRCIVEGHANDPITATGLTCATAGYSVMGLDSSALIMAGDVGPGNFDDANRAMQNFLYCNNNPSAASECNYGNAGSAATDVISGHPYFNLGELPESTLSRIAEQKAILSTTDRLKPYFAGEGSWGHNHIVNDPGLQAGYVARWFVALLISGVQRGYWFAWDGYGPDGTGGLWSPSNQDLPFMQCMTPTATAGDYCTGGTAYIQTVNWLTGANVDSYTCPGDCSKPSLGVFRFNISRTGNYQAQIAWDSSATAPCTNPQCGSTPFAAAPNATQWRDLAGNTYSGAPMTIGASPVIVENMQAP
jgi:hypothetical protein